MHIVYCSNFWFADDQNPSLNEQYDSVEPDENSEAGPQRCMY